MDLFSFLISRALAEGSLDAFMQITLTDKEREMLNERWRIFQLLRQGHTQRQVAEALAAGVATVTRGAKVYRDNKALIDKLLDSLEAQHVPLARPSKDTLA